MSVKEILKKTHDILPKNVYRWPIYTIRWDYIYWIQSMNLTIFKRHINKNINTIARELVNKFIEEQKKMDILCYEHIIEMDQKRLEKQKNVNILSSKHIKEHYH